MPTAAIGIWTCALCSYPNGKFLAFDEKDRENTSQTGYALPSEEEILIPEMYGHDSLRYELRLDAETGEPILDYASLGYDLNRSTPE